MTAIREFEKDRRFATTLARGLSVLRSFRVSDDGLGNAEIAERTGLPKSTVSRLTFTLQSLGYLTHAGKGDRYRPGPALLALGNMANSAISFVDLSAPLMQRLADQTRTMSVLAVRDEHKMQLVKTWRPAGVPSLWLEVGHRMPLTGSSSGYALLGALSDERFLPLLEQSRDDQNQYAEQLEQVRQHAREQLARQGFVIAGPDGYFTPNINAVSVPFHSRELSEPVVFTCGAVPEQLTREQLLAETGPALRSAVEELNRLTGQSSALHQAGY